MKDTVEYKEWLSEDVATKDFVRAENAAIRAEIVDIKVEIANVRTEIKSSENRLGYPIFMWTLLMIAAIIGGYFV